MTCPVLHAAAGQQRHADGGPVIAAAVTRIHLRRAAELAPGDDRYVVEAGRALPGRQ